MLVSRTRTGRHETEKTEDESNSPTCKKVGRNDFPDDTDTPRAATLRTEEGVHAHNAYRPRRPAWPRPTRKGVTRRRVREAGTAGRRRAGATSAPTATRGGGRTDGAGGDDGSDSPPRSLSLLSFVTYFENRILFVLFFYSVTDYYCSSFLSSCHRSFGRVAFRVLCACSASDRFCMCFRGDRRASPVLVEEGFGYEAG